MPSSAYGLTFCSFSTALSFVKFVVFLKLYKMFPICQSEDFTSELFSSLKLFAYVFCSFLSPALSVPTVSGLGEVGNSFGPFSDSSTCKKRSVCSLSCHHKMEAKFRFTEAKWRVTPVSKQMRGEDRPLSVPRQLLSS